jgi:galactokinase
MPGLAAAIIQGMEIKDKPFEVTGRALEPAQMLNALEGPAFLNYLRQHIYGDRDPAWLEEQRARYIETVRFHEAQFGNQPVYLLRAPGRLNLFTEYLDICRGDHMSTTTDGDIPLVLSFPEEADDWIRVRNTNPLFQADEFLIRQEFQRFLSAPWDQEETEDLADTWAWRSQVHPFHGRRRGDWINYILAPYLRMAFDHPRLALEGCDLTFGPSTIPIRAGTSSSSAVVVLATHALFMANRDVLPPMSVREVCRFMGEAEWYVGTRGGANDQTTIFRNRLNTILYNLHHLELIDSKSLPWLEGMELILCNSVWEADKALGARYIFNMRKGWTDLARDLLKEIIERAAACIDVGSAEKPGWLAAILHTLFPEMAPRPFEALESNPANWRTLTERFVHLGSLDEGLLNLERSVIESFIHLLPDFITTEEAGYALSKDETALDRDYTLPTQEDGGYQPRQAALFFFEENGIGRSLEALLEEAHEKLASGEITSDSEVYEAYRKNLAGHVSQVQELLRHVFQVSHRQLERLLEIAAIGPGYMSGKLTGAGSGGCVCILVRKGSADSMMAWLDKHYFGERENFDDYRAVLDKLGASPREEDRAKAREMRENLDQALREPAEQRRVITFSRGAGLISAEGF